MREFRQIIGALVSAGWTLDDVLGLTFDQIQELSKAIYAHKFQMLDSVLTPLVGGLSGKKKTKNLSTQKELRKSGMNAADRDKALMDKVSSLGLGVK